MTTEHADLNATLERIVRERAELVAATDPALIANYEQVLRRRNGIAVAEAVDGICTICHVRLRPQVFNTVLRNDRIMQCDTCQRFLYFVPKAAPQSAAQS
jgi:hypothetical protein